jgi:hypothetical protein
MGLALASFGVADTHALARDGRPDRSWMKRLQKPSMPPGPGVAGLPHARGRTFRSLDAYLAYLRDYAAPMDRPWYREVRPGVYQFETGNLRSDAPARTYTREELERRFGFRK